MTGQPRYTFTEFNSTDPFDEIEDVSMSSPDLDYEELGDFDENDIPDFDSMDDSDLM